MKNTVMPIERLINSFEKLVGVGKKTAQRYAYSVIDMSEQDAIDFANAIIDVKQNVHYCKVCGNFTEKEICDICSTRKSSVICVVKEPKDVLSLEKVKDFDVVYHVLHGCISPLEGKGPNDIRIKELLERLNTEDVSEVIMATNPDVEGEATAMYIAKLIKPLGIKVTRLAQGIAMGSDIEYADEVTLSKALGSRVEI